MRLGTILPFAAAATVIAVSAPASAAVVLPVQITYASGAYFQGNVTFADGYESILAVNGTLHGYAPLNPLFYNPASSTTINQLLVGGLDLAPGRWNYGTSLTDGFGNIIAFGYTFNQNSVPEFGNAGSYRSRINGRDNFVSGQVVVGGVPEPATWLLFILGFAGIGIMLRREQRQLKVSSDQIRFSYA
jgi:hypothetical protein